MQTHNRIRNLHFHSPSNWIFTKSACKSLLHSSHSIKPNNTRRNYWVQNPVLLSKVKNDYLQCQT